MMNREKLGEIALCCAFPVSLIASLLFCAVVWG